MKVGENEETTRLRRIDPRLEAADWSITDRVAGVPVSAYSAGAVREFETTNGPADYALCDGGRILGVAEAKKLTLGPQGVLTQAERYSRGVTQGNAVYQDEFKVPFLYSTNGEVTWFHDVRHPLNRSRQVSGFHTPTALNELLSRNLEGELAVLNGIPLNEYLRPYQRDANAATEQAITDRKRKMLVTMATGTGKTVTLVNEVYRLMKSGVAKRVLFLVDRRALAAQAVRTFSSFKAEPGLKFDKLYEMYSQRFWRDDLEEGGTFDPKVLPTNYLTDPQPGQAFVYVSTIQRMTINLFGRESGYIVSDETIDDDADRLNIPIHAFDLIIADECHRGYSGRELSIWRRTLDHFDGIKIGLTATPAFHTTSYFENLVYRYDYERAVREGYLVDYDVVRINSNVRMHGVFRKEGEQVGEVNPTSGAQTFDFLEEERAFDTTAIEHEITAPDSNRKILQEIKDYADEHEAEHGRFPKTLIFADNDLPHTSHCDQLVDQARDIFGRGDAFVAKITGRVDRPLQRIREFRNRPNPGIAVTVDMLSTGVDIPDLEFIVFLRPVKSRILFEQMLGRGTRRGEKYPDKGFFVVFDCFDGTLLDYFRNATGMTVEPPAADGKTIAQIIEEIWQNRDREYNIGRLVKRLHRIDKQMSGAARELFGRFIPDGDIADFAAELRGRLQSAFAETMSLLRDVEFQTLLADYPRPPRTFLVASETQDTVSSEWLIKGAIGQEYRPDDYLKAFDEFVRANAELVAPIAILLSRPQGWGVGALKELRQALALAPERFTEENLQKAFEVTHHKALVDIISMVKRAADDSSPLLTAEERVNQAVDRVTAAIDLTPEQEKWVEYIRQHLVANLSIDRDDFENVPVLMNRGGWGKANGVFGDTLPDFLDNLNRELVAA